MLFLGEIHKQEDTSLPKNASLKENYTRNCHRSFINKHLCKVIMDQVLLNKDKKINKLIICSTTNKETFVSCY